MKRGLSILNKLNEDADKRVVLDTNILLYDVDSLKKFSDNDIIIPTTVVEEIDGLKANHGGEGEKAYASRKISSVLKELATLDGNIREGVPLNILAKSDLLEDAEDYAEIEGKLFIVDSYDLFEANNMGLTLKDDAYVATSRLSNDDKIIAVAKILNARLITRDNNMIIKASGKVNVEEYRADKISVNSLYKGYCYLTLGTKDLLKLNQDGYMPNEVQEVYYDEETGQELPKGNVKYLYPNEFGIIDTGHASNLYVIAKGDVLKLIDFNKDLDFSMFSIKPKTIEQKMCMYLLQDPDILAVSFVGPSGKGKTYVGIDYALNKVRYDDGVNQFIYTKSMKEVDRSEALGALPGGVNDKMAEVVAPLYSTLESLYANSKHLMQLPTDNERADADLTGIEQEGELLAYKLRKDLMLNVIPLGYLRGRTLDKKVIMFDEAQNSTRHMIKTLTTRITDDSKLILTGDNEQIDDINLNKQNNGLSHFIENGKSERYIAHLTLDITRKNQRGKLAQFGNDLL